MSGTGGDMFCDGGDDDNDDDDIARTGQRTGRYPSSDFRDLGPARRQVDVSPLFSLG
jgi:hypothetical protein